MDTPIPPNPPAIVRSHDQISQKADYYIDHDGKKIDLHLFGSASPNGDSEMIFHNGSALKITTNSDNNWILVWDETGCTISGKINGPCTLIDKKLAVSCLKSIPKTPLPPHTGMYRQPD